MTIPPDVLAEANAAFDDAYANRCGPDECFKAALAVLSRHWPAADGRGSEVLTEACAWRKRNPGAVAAFELAAAVDRYLAALSTPAPAQNVRVVRALVEAAKTLIETSYQDPKGPFFVGEDEICALNSALAPFAEPGA